MTGTEQLSGQTRPMLGRSRIGAGRARPGAYSALRLYGSPIHVHATMKMYVLFPFVLLPVPCYEDVVMQAVLMITLSAETE